jgi:hypothetical protein
MTIMTTSAAMDTSNIYPLVKTKLVSLFNGLLEDYDDLATRQQNMRARMEALLFELDNMSEEEAKGDRPIYDIDGIDAATATMAQKTYTRGAEGEAGIHDVVSKAYEKRSPNYKVVKTGKIWHNCDLNVVYKDLETNETRGNVLLEVKNHISKVKTDKVLRFRSDLLTRDCDGIMVSIRSGICGHETNNIDLLENGKFAVYLSCTGYDGESIADRFAMER